MQKKLYMIFIIVLLNTYNTLADTGLIISFDQANNPLATINTEVTELYSDLGITFPSAPTISTIGLWESQVIKQGEALDRGTRIVPLCEPLEIVFDPTLEVRTVAMTVLTRHLQYYEIEAVNDLDGPILVDKSIFSDIPSVGGILRGPPLFSKRITLRAQTEEPIITRVVANIPTGDDGICFDLMVIDDLEINGPTFAPVEVTGQKRCWDPDGSSLLVDNTCLDSELTELEGQDGYLQAGVPFPEPRFVDNRDGTVKDNMTGLIWLKNPSCLRSKMTWKEALIEVKKLRENDDAYKDCRVENNVNWRMPNIKELQSLVDFGSFNPALPNKNWRMVPDCDDKAKDDCPSPCNEKENQCVFLGVEGGRFYWSSTSRIDSTNDNASGSKAWGVHFREGRTLAHFKSHDLSCELPFEERRCLFDEKLGIRPPYPDKCCKTKNPKPDDCCVRVKFAVWPVYGPELSTRLGVGNSCAKVEITGQETCWDPRTETNDVGVSPEKIENCKNHEESAICQDGALQVGVPYPRLRFKDNGDGTVRDNQTGLIWLKNASCLADDKDKDLVEEKVNWLKAFSAIKELNSGSTDRIVKCGLKKKYYDWRLPNVKELQSLIDFEEATGPHSRPVVPALPPDHLFNTSVKTGGFYWSSTTVANPEFSNCAWGVSMGSGLTHFDTKNRECIKTKVDGLNWVWAVRGGRVGRNYSD